MALLALHVSKLQKFIAALSDCSNETTVFPVKFANDVDEIRSDSAESMKADEP